MTRYGDVGAYYESLMKRIEELKEKADAAQKEKNHPLAEELLDEADNLLTAVILLRQIPEADVAPRSEVAREVFEEFEKMVCEKDTPITVMSILSTERYKELKKKYMTM